MFTPKTDKIRELAEEYPSRIEELSKIFEKTTNVYIDFANVVPWQQKLKWHVHLKRLKQLMDSFDTIRKVRLYNGTLSGDTYSETIAREARRSKYIFVTKPVKIMRVSIDASSIPASSTGILKRFIRSPLLKELSVKNIEYLNRCLSDLNRRDIMFLEDLKCNFDVEIGRDMLIDYASGEIDNFIIWSGDSDFADPVKQLLDDDKKVTLFITARKVSTELNDLRENGLAIFDIQKIRNFICWGREIEPKKEAIESADKSPGDITKHEEMVIKSKKDSTN